MFVHFFRGGLHPSHRPVGPPEGLFSSRQLGCSEVGEQHLVFPDLVLREDLMKEQFWKVKLSHEWNWNASPSFSSVPAMESKVLIFKLSVGTFFHREQWESVKYLYVVSYIGNVGHTLGNPRAWRSPQREEQGQRSWDRGVLDVIQGTVSLRVAGEWKFEND